MAMSIVPAMARMVSSSSRAARSLAVSNVTMILAFVAACTSTPPRNSSCARTEAAASGRTCTMALVMWSSAVMDRLAQFDRIGGAHAHAGPAAGTLRRDHAGQRNAAAQRMEFDGAGGAGVATGLADDAPRREAGRVDA